MEPRPKGDPVPDDKKLDILLSAPGGIFPPTIKAKLIFFIKKNWKTRAGKKTIDALFRESEHVCAREYFDVLINGDGKTPSFFKNYTDREQEFKEFESDLDELKKQKSPKYQEKLEDHEEMKKSWYNSVETSLDEISKIFTDGFFTVMKENIIFDDKGRPISVKETGGERFQKCKAKLEQEAIDRRALFADPEANTYALGKTLARDRLLQKESGEQEKIKEVISTNPDVSRLLTYLGGRAEFFTVPGYRLALLKSVALEWDKRKNKMRTKSSEDVIIKSLRQPCWSTHINISLDQLKQTLLRVAESSNRAELSEVSVLGHAIFNARAIVNGLGTSIDDTFTSDSTGHYVTGVRNLRGLQTYGNPPCSLSSMSPADFNREPADHKIEIIKYYNANSIPIPSGFIIPPGVNPATLLSVKAPVTPYQQALDREAVKLAVRGKARVTRRRKTKKKALRKYAKTQSRARRGP